MRKLAKATASLFLAALAGAGTMAMAQTPQSHYAVLVDISASNPLVEDALYASRVADDIGRMIAGIKLADWVTVGTLGAYDPTLNRLMERQVSTRFPPDLAIRSIVSLIASVPDAISSGQLVAQDATNLIGELQALARRVDCQATSVTVIVASDGRENTGNGLIIPPPESAIFANCDSMVLVGVLGKTAQETQDIGAAWLAWCEAAGFRRCDWRS